MSKSFSTGYSQQGTRGKEWCLFPEGKKGETSWGNETIGGSPTSTPTGGTRIASKRRRHYGPDHKEMTLGERRRKKGGLAQFI